MAGVLFAAVQPEAAFSTAAKSMLQVTAPTNQRVKVREWSASFIGTSNTAQPILTEILTGASTAGTSSSVTLRKWNPADDETIQSTAVHTCTVEPTGTLVAIQSEEIHPQTGYTWQSPFGGEIHIVGGGRLTLRVTAAAGSSLSSRFLCEE